MDGGGDGVMVIQSAYLYTSIQGEGGVGTVGRKMAVVVGLYVALAGAEWSVPCGICSDRLVSGYLCSLVFIH